MAHNTTSSGEQAVIAAAIKYRNALKAWRAALNAPGEMRDELRSSREAKGRAEAAMLEAAEALP